MKVRLLTFLTLTFTLTLPSLAFAQTARPDVGGDVVKGAEATALLKQIETERARLIEERREALVRAEKAQTPEEKIKIMQELQSTQRERKQKLHEDRAKVREAEKQDREEKRKQTANK